jgi:hypothetical protein
VPDRAHVHRTKRPVWAKLSLIYPQLTFPPRRFRHDDRTITITGDAPGELHGWYRPESPARSVTTA